MIEIKNLKHSYPDGHQALRDISLDIRRGEIFGLLGPNGSGKTTLFRILATLFPPGEGQARIGGLEVGRDFRQVRERLGIVFQSPSIDPKLTVWENLIYQGYVYGFCGKELRQRCGEMIERLGLGPRRHDLAGTLSGGLKRRVELAKGLLHRPEVLLLDEPSTGLDPGARRDLWQYLKKLREEAATTVLVTTHLMEEAEHCDRIAIMNEGKLVRLGTPADLKSEVGGDVLVVKARGGGEELARQIRSRMGLESHLLNGVLQIEHPEGARFITQLIENFPGRVESVTFRKPTLEDVFVHHTGHTFWEDRERVS